VVWTRTLQWVHREICKPAGVQEKLVTTVSFADVTQDAASGGDVDLESTTVSGVNNGRGEKGVYGRETCNGSSERSTTAQREWSGATP
jgi:hypothetical protein